MSPITTHVLDTAAGRPARGLRVRLEARGPSGRFKKLAQGATDANGRITDLLAGRHLARGIYRLVFATGDYFRSARTVSFYPEVSVVFEIRKPAEHHHVPLLLSPFGYSTYRGS
jgi:5-hydroxyisourate hydrolase